MFAILCGVDEPPEPARPDECPSHELHTPAPRGFIPSFTWAMRMMVTHHQTGPCPGCGRYAIWAPGRDVEAVEELADDIAVAFDLEPDELALCLARGGAS